MKINKNIYIIFTTAFLLALMVPASVSAAPLSDGRTVVGETYTLESGRILNGDLNVFGGVVNIQSRATVNGNVFVLGGLVNIDGTIQGDLTAIGGTVNLNANAVVDGNLISPASYINIDEDAVIQGDIQEGFSIPWSGIQIPQLSRTSTPLMPRIRLLPVLNMIGRQISITLVMIGLSALLLLIMPGATENMTSALTLQPWHVLGYGALTAFVMLAGGLILTITICFIPVVILVALTFGLAVLVGWLALGYELGKSIASGIFKSTWHPVLTAVIGNLVLYITAKGVGLIPCLGGFIVFIAMLFGLGMAVVTLFGSYPYPRDESPDELEPVILFDGTPQSPIEDQASSQPKVIHEPIVPTTEDPLIASPSLVEPLESLGLRTRLENILTQAGLTSTGDVIELLSQGDKAVMEIDGFGKKSLDELKTLLKASGYQINE